MQQINVPSAKPKGFLTTSRTGNGAGNTESLKFRHVLFEVCDSFYTYFLLSQTRNRKVTKSLRTLVWNQMKMALMARTFST